MVLDNVMTYWRRFYFLVSSDNDSVEMSYVMVTNYVQLFSHCRGCNFVKVMLERGWVIVIVVKRQLGVRGC